MINRFVFNSLWNEIRKPEINILLGPRQVGKTTLLRMLEVRAREDGFKTAFFDLEQPDVLAELNLPQREVIKRLAEAGDVVFIDEFHYLENASKIFKAIYDAKQKTKIICSGSSSVEIHKHLKESLAGRRFLFRLFPLSYSEIRSSRHDAPLNGYLIYGGMPGVVEEPDLLRKQKILQELLQAYILKDIKSLIREENLTAFNHLLYLLAEKQGSLISVHALAKEVGLSSKAVNHYLDVLQQTFVHERVYSYSNNLGNELKKSCKSYLYDLGIRSMMLKDFSSVESRTDRGIMHETFVYLKLKQTLKPNQEVRFWRTKAGDEVDFILIEDRKPVPIEVKSHINSLEIPRGLRRFLLRYPSVKEAYVVNKSLQGKRTSGVTNIHFISFETFESQWGKPT